MLVFFKQMTGSYSLKFPGFAFKFAISNTGFITIGHVKIHIVLSKSVHFPSSSGWFMFVFKKYTYYLRWTVKGLVVNRFGAGCKKSVKGMKGFCGAVTGAKTTGN